MNQVNRNQATLRAVYFSIAANVVLALVKWFTGYFGNSYALIADAIESSADVFSTLLVLLAVRYSLKAADKSHPYGHGRVEPLATFAVTAFLLFSAIAIAYQSIWNILTPHELPEPFTLIVLGSIVLIKELLYRRIIKKGNETGSSPLKADAWHHRSDAITSGAAFLGISIALLFGKGYEAADDWAALIASGFILYNSYLIFRPALGEIMDEHYYDDIIGKIRVISESVNGIHGTEKCLVRKTGAQFYVILHAEVDGKLSVNEGHLIGHNLKDKLMSEIPDIADIVVHIEPS